MSSKKKLKNKIKNLEARVIQLEYQNMINLQIAQQQSQQEASQEDTKPVVVMGFRK